MLVIYHKFAEFEKKISKMVSLFLFFIVSLQPMNRTDLTQGSIWGNITTFLLPYILAYFLQILYGLVDLFVIGMQIYHFFSKVVHCELIFLQK